MKCDGRGISLNQKSLFNQSSYNQDNQDNLFVLVECWAIVIFQRHLFILRMYISTMSKFEF